MTADGTAARTVAQVRVEPADVTLDVHEDETLIEAAWRQGYYWPTICEGKAECGQCFVEILVGEENVSPRTEDEHATIVDVFGRTEEATEAFGYAPRPRPYADRVDELRLACCLRLTGDALVKKRGLRYVGHDPRAK